MSKVLSLLFLLGAALGVAAQPVALYQVEDAQGIFLQVPLTHDIYRYSEDAGLRDILVLDAKQNSLPYKLVSRPQTIQKSDAKVVTQPLAFFAIAPDTTPDTLRKLHTMQVTHQADKIQIATSDKTLNNNTPEFYLIDVSKLEQDVTDLQFDWLTQADTQYLEVQLEATRDLKSWFSVAQGALVHVQQEAASLKRDRIELPITKNDYEFLRLKILRGGDHLQITKVTAEQRVDAVKELAKNGESWNLEGSIAKDQNTVYLPGAHSKTYAVAAWEFLRNETTPVESVALALGDAHYADSVKLFSRHDENQGWTLRHQGIWFNAQLGSKWQRSDAIDVYRITDKYWRVELNESARNKINPQLVFAWQPVQLQFIANDKPPFQLALDRASRENHAQVFDQLLANTKPEWVSVGLKLLDPKNADLRPANSLDWKRYLFWGALVLAVVLLLFFSIRLFRQIGAGGQ